MRDRHAGFFGVVGIVQTDADELADVADAGADAGRSVHLGQALRVEARQLGETGLAKRIPGDIRNDALQRADRTVAVHQGWLFLALGADAHQFHSLPLLRGAF